MDIYKQIASNNRQTFFILFLFTAVIIALTFVVTVIIEVPPEQFPAISVVVFSAVIAWTLIAYYFGAGMITSFVGAKPVVRKEHFDLYNIIENLAITSGLPTPKAYIIQDESLNAFATGRNPKNGIVCVTSGLLKKLNKRELEAVIAHEMGHIANYDIRLQLIVITVIGLISMLG